MAYLDANAVKDRSDFCRPLLGFDSRMGSGCTSDHGVVGLARLSPRSFVAVVTFLANGLVSVAALKLL